jgi:hypothetical protein
MPLRGGRQRGTLDPRCGGNSGHPMLRLRRLVLIWLSFCVLGLNAPPAGAGGRGGGAHFGAHFAPHFSAPHIQPQVSAPRMSVPMPRTFAAPAYRAPAVATLHVPTQQRFRSPTAAYATGSIANIRVWRGNPFAQRTFTFGRFGGLHTHVHTRLQPARLSPFFAPRQHRVRGNAVLWTGALFWPDAFGDFFDYTLDPYAYYGYSPYPYPDLHQGIFGEPIASAYAAIPARRSGATEEPCGAAALTAWRIEEIVERLDLDNAQRAALIELNDAAAEAFAPASASCRDALPMTPVSRLAAVQTRLSGILHRLDSVRPAFARFYGSLTPEQKAQLNAPAPDGAQCGARPFASLPIEAIARELRANASQRAALLDLQHALAQAGDMLKRECAPERQLVSPESFDQIERELRTALSATEVIAPALAAFYALLRTEQKERFARIAGNSL